jgi:signal transduction histidine kinase/CheY-like chemotaxis protein
MTKAPSKDSYKKRFIMFIVLSFSAILLASMLIVSHMLNSSFDDQVEKEINTRLEIHSYKINDKFTSIVKVLSDHANKSTIVTALMQFDQNSFALNDYLDELTIIGYKGAFSIVSFDMQSIFGHTDFNHSDFEQIINGDQNFSVSILNEDAQSFQFMIPIKFQGNIEGVMVFDTHIPISNLISTHDTNWNIQISKREKSIKVGALDSNNMELTRHQKKLLNDFFLSIYHDPYLYIKGKIETIFILFFFLSTSVGLFSIFFYIRGKGEFVDPHEELLEIKEELMESNLFRESIINSSTHIIISTDIYGVIKSFNKAAEYNLGYPAVSVVDRETPLLFHKKEDVVARVQELNSSYGINLSPGFDVFTYEVSNGKEYEDKEWTYIRKDGTEFSGRLIVSAIKKKIGQVIGYLCVIEDITTLNIVKEMESLTREKLEQTAKMKTEFLANMSHEIRTPLNGVLGMVQLLNETVLNDEQLDMLAVVRSSGDSLLRILNDILDISKIESGMLTLEHRNFNLNSSIRDAINLHSYNAQSKNVLIEFDNPEHLDFWFLGDEVRVSQIIGNYLSNALKFTHDGSVKVTASTQQVDEIRCILTVSVIDTGIGISEKSIKKLFQSFSQADASTTRKYGGTGLGLSICSKLAKLMGGEVFVDSREGEGSTFRFKIPLEFGLSIDLIPKLVKPKILLSSKHKHKILLVEDNLVNQKVITLVLKKMGYSCDLAVNGNEAYDMVTASSTSNYTIIFMDMQMPEMDGIEATVKIINKLGTNTPPIVAITASAFAEDKEKCFNAGMVDFISKPIDTSEISRVLKEFA